MVQWESGIVNERAILTQLGVWVITNLTFSTNFGLRFLSFWFFQTHGRILRLYWIFGAKVETSTVFWARYIAKKNKGLAAWIDRSYTMLIFNLLNLFLSSSNAKLECCLNRICFCK